MMKKFYSTIAQRVADINERIENAAIKAGRKADEITLIGVTKTQSASDVRQLIDAGVFNIGENRVQEMLEKEAFIKDLPHKTHLIGHLQRNKAKFLPTHIDMLQSVDSVQLVETLERVYEKENKKLDVLIEVNIGEEAGKNGVLPCEFKPLVEKLVQSSFLTLRGLMAIPPFGLGENVRDYFHQMYQLFVDIKGEKMDNNNIDILSMGMSSDFEHAIVEGANMVRVGTDLFGNRK